MKFSRRKRSGDRLYRLLRVITFIEALVSVLTLQSTLIAVNSGGGEDRSMLPLTAITSAAVLTATVAISVAVLVRALRERTHRKTD